VTQEGNISQLHEMDQIGENTENLLRDTDNDQIQLNSMEFNGNQWMSTEINEHQLNLVEFNRNQLISIDIDRFQPISTNIMGDQ